jgi:nitroreductase
MDVFEAIYKRRSLRSFKSSPVPEDYVKKIIAAATMAPTGGDMQPWEFFVITDQNIKTRIIETTYTGYDTTGEPQYWLQNAPVLILVCFDKKRTGARYGKEGAKVIPLLDCACAIENMLLAATALGLGGCWVWGFNKEKLEKVFSLNGLEPLALIPLGYPSHVPNAPYRLELEYIYHEIT